MRSLVRHNRASKVTHGTNLQDARLPHTRVNIACPGPLNCGDGARWRIFGVVGSCRKRNQLSRFASNDSRGRVTRKHQAHVDRFHTKFKTGRRTTGCTNARALGYMRWRADGIGRRALAGGAEFRASRAAEVVVSNRLDAQRTGLEYNNGGRFGSMGCSQISTHAPGTICTNKRKRSPLLAKCVPAPFSACFVRQLPRNESMFTPHGRQLNRGAPSA